MTPLPDCASPCFVRTAQKCWIAALRRFGSSILYGSPWSNDVEAHLAEEIAGFEFDPALSSIEIMGINLNPDAVPSPLHRRDSSCPRPHERIQDCVACEAEHANESLREFFGVWCWMVFGGCARYVAPDLLEPTLLVVDRDLLKDSCR